MTEIRQFKDKTISRIIDWKQEAQRREVQKEEDKRKQDNAFRREWQEKYRHKRAKEIVETVDNFIVSNSLPVALHRKICYRSKKAENEQKLRQLTVDLEETGHSGVVVKRDSGQYAMVIQNNGGGTSALIEFKNGQKKSIADCFLRSAIAAKHFQGARHDGSLLDLLRQNGGSSESKPSGRSSKQNESQLSDLLRELFDTPRDLSTNYVASGYMERVMALAKRSNWLSFYHPGEPSAVGSSGSGANTPLSEQPKLPKQTYSQNTFRNALVDMCYLIGPDRASIADAIRTKQMAAAAAASASAAASVLSSGDESSGGVSMNPDSSKQSKARIQKDDRSKYVLQPTVLYRSDGDEPEEMVQMLPKYCFPSNVDLYLTSRQGSSKPPGNLSSPQGGEKTKKAKKARVFFPSDYTIQQSASDAAAACAEKVLSMTSPALSTHATPYVIFIGEHHSSYRFGLCLQFPVTFLDTDHNLWIETYYTLCLLTRFPFINFAFYSLMKIDEEKSICSFSEPLPAFDAHIIPHGDLAGLQELIPKLHQLSAPLYPYFIVERRGIFEGDKLQAESYYSYLPDIQLNFRLKSSTVDLPKLSRGYYQMFYTNIGHPMEENQLLLLDAPVRNFDITVTQSVR